MNRFLTLASMLTFIDKNTPLDLIENLTVVQKVLCDDEHVLSSDIAGEGNMNVVLRIKTDRQSFILKQSRPFVQKYQDIKAPLDRIHTEYSFYRALSFQGERHYLPKILAYEPENHLLILSDLGSATDCTSIYKNTSEIQKLISPLCSYTRDIHQTEPLNTFPKNKELKALNHQHIFALPFVENGFDLNDIQEGLAPLAKPFKHNPSLQKNIDEIGALYLSDTGNTLIHGDYYPGSWLSVNQKTYIIDPEFSFKGFAEFDLGVMGAHFILASASIEHLGNILEHYKAYADKLLVRKIAGIEISRRLIGLAQLPLERSIQEKKELLDIAYDLITT